MRNLFAVSHVCAHACKKAQISIKGRSYVPAMDGGVADPLETYASRVASDRGVGEACFLRVGPVMVKPHERN